MTDRPTIALYQPDIAGNTGTILRLAACLGVEVDIIEPAGFRLDDKSLKRAGMDYLALARLIRHADWTEFESWRQQTGRRLVLVTTRADQPYFDYRFQTNDVILFGRESAGVPDHVHHVADTRLVIPMTSNARSINLAVSAGIVIAESLRQLNWNLE